LSAQNGFEITAIGAEGGTPGDGAIGTSNARNGSRTLTPHPRGRHREPFHRDRTEGGYRRFRPPAPSTGSTSGACPGYVKDHVIPLACGGADSVGNLQWQTVEDAKAKDRWERQGCTDTSSAAAGKGNLCGHDQNGIVLRGCH
jgi:hypothetical protein